MSGSLAAVNLPAALPAPSYNADNEQTVFNGATLSYDANGNLQTDGTNTYTFDARNHLTAINGGVTASFVYDAFGRRMSKITGGNATQFLHDGLNSVQEMSGGGTVNANLMTGLGIDENYLRTDSSGMVSFLADALGSTVGLVGSSGTIGTNYTYQPFGAATVNGTNANPYQFTGRENDATGLYFYRARYYSPTFQRFVSQDPIGFGGGDANLYRYAYDNAVNGRDPSGQGLIGGGIGLIIGGLEGYEAARLQGQCGWDAAISAGLGALGGLGVGLLDPSEGVLSFGEIVTIGGEAGAAGDILGQLWGNGWNFDDLGPFEIAGAALGGAGATALGLWGAGAASTEVGGAALGSWAGAGPGLYGGPIGAELDNLAFPSAGGGSSSSCGCSH